MQAPSVPSAVLMEQQYAGGAEEGVAQGKTGQPATVVNKPFTQTGSSLPLAETHWLLASQQYPGVGGFVNISQNAQRLVFCGTFTTGGLEIDVTAQALRIVREGGVRKFVRAVEQISFSGRYAVERGQPVLYVTERAVFQLLPEGLELIEVAPGIDLKRDVLDQMDFHPLIRAVRPMSAVLFRE